MVLPHWWFILAAKAAHWAWKRLSDPAVELPPNVARTEDGAAPAPGFEWVSESSDDLAVRWVPGKRWPEMRLVAGPQPSDWRPERGYVWVAPENRESLEVRWAPGREYEDTHLVTGPTEGEWHPCPGYSWRSPHVPGCLDVDWTPGKAHSKALHVLAAAEEGRWRPEPGWKWVSRERDDLRVELVHEERNGGGVDFQRLRDLAMLGLDESATRQGIETAFRRLIKLHHPDRFNGQGEDERHAANRAFVLLRAAHDRLMAAYGGAS